MASCMMESCEVYDDYESDIEESNNSNIISFYQEIEPIIKQCIKNYFSDKFLHDGRKMPEDLLELPFYSSLLFNTNVSDGITKAYFLMEENNFLTNSDCDQNSVGEEIKYIIRLLSGIQRKIPQEFIGGMILMHLELIEGIEIW